MPMTTFTPSAWFAARRSHTRFLIIYSQSVFCVPCKPQPRSGRDAVGAFVTYYYDERSH